MWLRLTVITVFTVLSETCFDLHYEYTALHNIIHILMIISAILNLPKYIVYKYTNILVLIKISVMVWNDLVQQDSIHAMQAIGIPIYSFITISIPSKVK